MNPITPGSEAPDFTLIDNHENYIRLSDYRGKRVLLSWHPLAWTPVCTDQMRALEVNLEAFEKLNTVPLGLSVDPQPTKTAWANALLINRVSLPSDFWPHGKVTMAYGLFDEREGVSGRAKVIVDENGKIKWVKVYPSQQLPDINEVLQVLSNN